MYRLYLTKQFIKHFHRAAESNKVTLSAIQRLENKVKGTIVENWVRYWKNVFIDYRDVAIDVGKHIKEKPYKSVVMLWGISGLIVCAKYNPNETDFRDEYLKCTNRLILVHGNSQNHETLQHLRHIESSYNKRQVRTLNFLFGTIMWTDHNSQDCDKYTSNCPYLTVQYSKFRDRILDIGFLNTWWMLTKKMETYDINY